MNSTEPIIYKVPHEDSQTKEFFTRWVGRSWTAKSREKDPFRILAASIGYISSAGKAYMHISQDGLNHRHVSLNDKIKFKEGLREFRERALPELPKPFTGGIEFHCDKESLTVIKFYPH